MCPDHPRSRGVDTVKARARQRCTGSSPLARGRRYRFPGGGLAAWDHPRSRGVDNQHCRVDVNDAGSSPLARGRRRTLGDTARPRGIIPARAGSTSATPPGGWYFPDHPRSRGVDWVIWSRCAVMSGSSPLARGRRLRYGRVRRWSGIIPARAGSTVGGSRVGARLWDHPRSRGVDRQREMLSNCFKGSSPLARGRPTDRNRPGRWRRIIPARAGSTAPEADWGHRLEDHPRSRGVDGSAGTRLKR